MQQGRTGTEARGHNFVGPKFLDIPLAILLIARRLKTLGFTGSYELFIKGDFYDVKTEAEILMDKLWYTPHIKLRQLIALLIDVIEFITKPDIFLIKWHDLEDELIWQGYWPLKNA